MEKTNDPGDERGGTPQVGAYLCLTTHTISITMDSSVSLASITVKDVYGTVVYRDMVDASVCGFTEFIVPVASGTFSLEIRSSTYDGIGFFSI